jgi:alpha-amylase
MGVLGSAAVGLGTGTGSGSSQNETGGSRTVYQYYHTDWTTITADLSDIAAAGYDAIQVPPAQRSRLDRSHQKGVTDPPLGYQPVDLRDFNSVFGTEAEYERMVEEAHAQGLEVIADAVVNHMAANDGFRDAQGITFEELPYFSERDFHPPGSIDYGSPESVENDWLVGLKDLRQESSYVRKQLRRYVNKYADIGVDGIRWDAVKHVPEWFFAKYANEWAAKRDLWTVGECLDGSVPYCAGYADTGMAVTDYPLYYTMKGAFTPGGDLSRLENAGYVDQDPSGALTFVSNHDSGPPEFEKLAYAYILTYEGNPRVYNKQIDVSDDDIRNLLWIRNNLAAGTAITRHADEDVYVFEREGNLLVGLNKTDRWQSRRVNTTWLNERLNDYTGKARDITTDLFKTARIWIPPTGWVCHAPESQRS